MKTQNVVVGTSIGYKILRLAGVVWNQGVGDFKMCGAKFCRKFSDQREKAARAAKFSQLWRKLSL